MKVAALDLGSNTFLCLIAEVLDQQITSIYSDQVEVVRLGQGLSQSKRFAPEALLRAEKTLTQFKKVIDLHKPERVLAMATSAARDAENKQDLFDICKKLNIPLDIISGDQEAQITYSGSISGQKENSNKTQLVIDIGGGSTELIFGLGQKVLKGLSLNIGCVRLTEKFFNTEIVSAEQINLCRLHIKDHLLSAKLKLNGEASQIIAVAGTPTSLAAAEIGFFDIEKIDGYLLTIETLEKWMHKLPGATLDQKIKMGLPPGRADVILVGVIILLECLQIFEHSHIITSTRGVRFGIALQMAST